MEDLSKERIEELSVNAIRFLSADAIQKAKSGHPGLPLGCAPIGYEVWADHLKHNPDVPRWSDRDRFILSGGHGSMMLYSLLHLFGYENMDLDAIKNFRQMGSNTPGHPEYGHTTGVDATTGPLGQGMSMAVGMAMAEAHLASVFNKPDFPVVDHYTYVLGGDGCMMEGISSEAFSLAGDLGLNKLIVLYDSNKICIEGSTDGVFSENISERMEAFGFQTITVHDGNNLNEIDDAIHKAKNDTDRPSFIIIETQIGYGCPAKQGSASAHGEPLGEENISEMRKTLGWPVEEAFKVPDEVYENYKEKAKRGKEAYKEWEELFAYYAKEYPDMKEKWDKYHSGFDVKDLFDSDDYWEVPDKPEATRSSSGAVLNKICKEVLNLLGGSADLGPSNKTYMKEAGDFSKDDYSGRNIRFGVREAAMAGISNGIALHGGLKPYAATFFVFSDYVKPMARLSALMGLPVTYVFTHDSIGVGEDGPTHEPIEQLAMLRAMPGFTVIRPCDRRETAAAWKYAIEAQEPVALVLTRQNLNQQKDSAKDISKGAYIIRDCGCTPELILIATGSEVDLCVRAAEELSGKGRNVRVVSMPSTDLFEKQSDDYKESVLPGVCTKRVSVEALSSFGWGRYTGFEGKNISIDTFGESAPAGELFEKYGFTVENVIKTAESLLD